MRKPAPERCPICDAALGPAASGQPGSAGPSVGSSGPFAPFCSKRCKLLDLSRWLSEDYRVPGDPAGDGGVSSPPSSEDANE